MLPVKILRNDVFHALAGLNPRKAYIPDYNILVLTTDSLNVGVCYFLYEKQVCDRNVSFRNKIFFSLIYFYLAHYPLFDHLVFGGIYIYISSISKAEFFAQNFAKILYL